MITKIIETIKELENLKTLLKECKLPYADIQLNSSFFVGYYNSNGHLIASGGLEFYGTSALLRSLAVRETFRNQSLATNILNELIFKAKDQHITSIYLLTESAYDYFLKRGFKDCSRDHVPELVKMSSEFSSVCPVSAKCLIYNF
jgi:amino-acid N-acetyltransferase